MGSSGRVGEGVPGAIHCSASAHVGVVYVNYQVGS